MVSGCIVLLEFRADLRYNSPIHTEIRNNSDIEGARHMTMERDGRFHALVQATLLDVGAKRSRMRGGELEHAQGVAPVEQLVSYALEQAAALHASDIHVEPVAGGGVRIRVRIDGLLQEWQEPLPQKVAAVFLSRLKVLAKMDVSKTREPQDGSFHFSWDGRQVDVRVATMPTIDGEALVMRLLLHGERARRLDDLGFRPETAEKLRSLFHQPSGISMFCGPMNSGKTTTLYAALAELMKPETSVVTIDDPVEYVLPGAMQVTVQESKAGQESGRTFSDVLKHMLRMDAEILSVGETRDEKTAALALRAALTGHRVFTTLHAGDACSAILRMLEMKLPPYLLAATLTGVVAQRLVRRICPACRESYAATAHEAELLGMPAGTELVRGRGCEACHGTGYQDRMVLAEVLVLTEALREAIATGAHLSELRKLAKEAGCETFAEDGRQKILAGFTTCAEVERVLYGG